jgi:hypothetical protein
MKRGLSPMFLATVAIGGAGLAAASYFVSLLDLPRFPAEGNGVWARAWADRLHLALFLVPMVLGIAVYLLAVWRFKRELREERWPEASLAPVRSLLLRPWWGWCGFALFAVAGLLLVCVKKDFNGAVYLLALPSNAVARLRWLVNPPDFRSTVSLDLSCAQPPRSEHWGESRG